MNSSLIAMPRLYHGKISADFAERTCNRCHYALSDFVEIRGVRTPPLEDIPGYVRRCGEHLLGKKITLLTSVAFRLRCTHVGTYT